MRLSPLYSPNFQLTEPKSSLGSLVNWGADDQRGVSRGHGCAKGLPSPHSRPSSPFVQRWETDFRRRRGASVCISALTFTVFTQFFPSFIVVFSGGILIFERRGSLLLGFFRDNCNPFESYYRSFSWIGIQPPQIDLGIWFTLRWSPPPNQDSVPSLFQGFFRFSLARSTVFPSFFLRDFPPRVRSSHTEIRSFPLPPPYLPLTFPLRCCNHLALQAAALLTTAGILVLKITSRPRHSSAKNKYLTCN